MHTIPTSLCFIAVWRWLISATKIELLNRHWGNHYNDVIMSTVASQITSPTIVYSVVYSGADQRKNKSSSSLAFVKGIHQFTGDRWIPRTKGQ